MKLIRAIASVAAFAAGATIVSGQASPIFFTEGWESGSATGSFNSSWYGQATQSQFSVQTATKAAGNFSLRHIVTAGQDPGSVQYATQHFGDARSGPVWVTGRGNHYYDMYVQYKVYYSPGFNFNTNFKQLIIGTEDDLNQTAQCCNPWVAHYITIYAGPGGAQLAEGNNKQSGNQWMDFWPNAGGYSNSNRLNLQSGRWYTIEVRRKLNDAGVDNGIFQMWVDGQIIADYRAVRARVPRSGSYGSNFTYGTNFALISDYPFNAPAQGGSIYYDDIKMSTSYIGTDTSVLTAPRNLRVVP